MNSLQAVLYERLRTFDFDEGKPELTFIARLAHENGWSEKYASRAVQEYRRFLLLAMTAGHPVSPSDAVDQVWHLHLCSTQSYWDRLCSVVLGKPLHHHPTRGGVEESRKFIAMYRKTLLTYRTVFGEVPPEDIWPAPG